MSDKFIAKNKKHDESESVNSDRESDDKEE